MSLPPPMNEIYRHAVPFALWAVEFSVLILLPMSLFRRLRGIVGRLLLNLSYGMAITGCIGACLWLFESLKAPPTITEDLLAMLTSALLMYGFGTLARRSHRRRIGV